MKPQTVLDPDFRSNARRWYWPIRSIGQLMIVVALSGLVLSVYPMKSQPQSRGPLNIARVPGTSVVRALDLTVKPPVAVRPPADRFTVVASPDIDPAMVITARPDIDPGMVVHRGDDEPRLNPGQIPTPLPNQEGLRFRPPVPGVVPYRLTLALLLLDQGHSIADIADELRVARQTVSRWRDHFLTSPSPRSLIDHRGHAHVSAWDDERLAVLRALIQQPPADWGSTALEWTVPLLQEHLARWDGCRWSEATLRRQLHRLGYVWKRPRYVLRPDPSRARKVRRIRQQIKGLNRRTAILFQDETDLLLFPPLRSCWARVVRG